MRKGLMTLLLVLLAFCGALPLVMGYVTKQRLDEWVALIDSPSINIEQTAFNRGWLHSQASYAIAIDPSSLAFAKELNADLKEGLSHLSLDMNISNGPLMINKKSQSMFNMGIAKIAMQLSGTTDNTRELLNGNLFFYFSGRTAMEFTNKDHPLKIDDHGLSQLTWHNIDIQVNTNKTDELNINAYLGNIVLNIPGLVSINIDNGRLYGIKRKGPNHLWLGEMTFTLPSITANDEAVIQEFSVQTSTSSDDNLINTSWLGSIKQLNVKGDLYGPAHVGIKLSNMESGALAELKNLQYENDNTQAHKKEELTEAYKVLLPQVMTKDFKIQIDPFSIKTPSGPINAQAEFSFPSLADTAISDSNTLLEALDATVAIQLPRSLMNLSAFIIALRNQGQGETPTDATQHSQQLIQSWLNDGLLLQQGNQYLTTVQYSEGRLTVNGKPIQAPSRENVNKMQ